MVEALEVVEVRDEDPDEWVDLKQQVQEGIVFAQTVGIKSSMFQENPATSKNARNVGQH